MELITYKDLEWYVMSENNKEKLLLMKDCFTNEMIRKYFDKYDKYYDVHFNNDISKIWWTDSYIRKILNEKFILDLDKKDLNVTKTILNLNGQAIETEDYVRLLTIEEVRKIKQIEESILYTKRQYGYWTMSPSHFDGIHAVVFGLGSSNYPGLLYVYLSRGVRPVISLKNNTISDEEFKSEFRKYLSL